MLAATLSKPGGRPTNEDFVGCWTPDAGLSCWVVADGQGGYGLTGLVAQEVVESILSAWKSNPAISQAVLLKVFEYAHQTVLHLQSSQKLENSPRATVAMFCTGGRSALWAHIGDVRVYAFRGGELIAKTKDHSVSQVFVTAGENSAEKIRGRAERNRLLGFLGSRGKVCPAILENKFILEPGDLFLICTDGFWEYVTELEMLADWCKSPSLEDWLEHMEMRLLLAAPAGHDNYSAIALLAES